MKLIDDWQTAYKKFSVQALIVIGALQSASAAVPRVMQLHVPFLTGVTWADALSAITAGVALLGIVGRVIDQEEGR